MSKAKERTIFLIDCQSFYASVEKAAHPEHHDSPVVVAADPSRRSGIILAACPLAKAYGITTAQRLGEAIAKCPQLVVIRPRMQRYIDVSLMITETLESFSDLVEPFSIDEQFVDMTESLSLFGSPEAVARHIQARIMLQTGVWARIGISSTKVLAKMACDIYAKKQPDGIRTLPKEHIAELLWPQPIPLMHGVGSRMTAHFARMGVSTIGDLAAMPLPRLKEKMKTRLGRNSDIQAEVYWRTAHGIDDSPVSPDMSGSQQGVGHHMTLPHEYRDKSSIDVILLELSEEVCRRCRARGCSGQTVSVGAQSDVSGRPRGFYRQARLPAPSNITNEVYEAVRKLFYRHWDGTPIRRAGLTLSDFTDDQEYQLSLLHNRERLRGLEHVTDQLKNRFGSTAVLRASSLLSGGQARERSAKIGGHYK